MPADLVSIAVVSDVLLLSDLESGHEVDNIFIIYEYMRYALLQTFGIHDGVFVNHYV